LRIASVVRLLAGGYDHDRDLLTRSRQRSQQSSLPLGTSHPQVFETKIELVKLQVHGDCPRRSTLPASDEAFAVSMQARDTLSRTTQPYPRSDKDLQM
jgi:hypothetical protein